MVQIRRILRARLYGIDFLCGWGDKMSLTDHIRGTVFPDGGVLAQFSAQVVGVSHVPCAQRVENSPFKKFPGGLPSRNGQALNLLIYKSAVKINIGTLVQSL